MTVNTLHPLVALSPLVGLAVMICCHILGMRLTRGCAHLGPVLLGMVVALVAALFVAVEGTSRMLWLPGESPVPLWLMVFCATVSLGYGYFTFVNLNTTSLRIRIIRELAERSGGAEKERVLLSSYSGADVVHARIQRLQAWKQVEVREKRLILNPGIFAFLGGMITQLRLLILPPKALSRRISLQMPSLLHQRQIIQILWICLGLALVAFYYTGIISELHKNVTERARYHAIPVALSQIYHGRVHDYTGWKGLALPFQSSEDIQNLISQSINLKIDQNGAVYYWLSDDRGYSDLVNLSFRIFGPTIFGLFNGFFALFVFSAVIAACGLRRWPPAFAVLVLFVVAYASFLPIINAAAGNKVAWTNYRIHLSETRTYEILGLIFILQAACSFHFVRRLRLDECLLLGLQGLIFGFLYSCRSSLGWILFGTASFGFVYFFIFIKNRPALSQGQKKLFITKAIWVATSLLAIAWGTLFFKGIHRTLESPVYLDWGGSRTFYHNALMGVENLKWLDGTWGVDDSATIDNVNRWLESQGEPNFDRQGLLNSLGGHGSANWHAYEEAAKKLYQSLWHKDPVGMTANYFQKGIKSLVAVRSTLATLIFANEENNIEWMFVGTPFRFDLIFISLVPFLVIASEKRFLPFISTFIFAGLGFALIPATVFYLGTLTISGAAVLVRLLAFCAFISFIKKVSAFLFEIHKTQICNNSKIPTKLFVDIVFWGGWAAFLLWLLFPKPILKLIP